jgi:hypothetical protein
MTRADLDRTSAVRTWLATAASEELSPRVLDTVLREFPAMDQDRPHWAPAWPQFSSFAAGAAIGAALVVTLVVAMIGAGLWPGYQPGGTGATVTPTPALSRTPDTLDRSYRDVGFIGLPPRDATPSDPTDTELIESFLRPGPPYKGAAFLYADGRLIWNEYFGDKSTGWLEQSLTDNGIALVRALPLQTWMGQRVLSPEELSGLLPSAAWVDQTVRPYVPSGFAACLNVSEQVNPFTESNMTQEEILAALPRAAADLLRDRPPVVDSSDSYGADPFDCLGLDVADARRLDAVLRAAEFEQDAWIYHKVLDRPEAGTWWLNVFLEPILPDGTITCSSCG